MQGSPNSEALEAGALALEAGALVVYPTETLYGLGADALNQAALRKLAALKVRDDRTPISVLVSSLEMVGRLAVGVGPRARRLMERFWPGPLTLVLPARAEVSSILTGGTGTIGVRLSSHPMATALVMRLGRPISTPSANPGGGKPAITVAEARAYFGDRIALYLDGGTLPGGPGSTVADVTGDDLRIVREGAIGSAALHAALTDAA
jgi:L-threonylcarbamoyladenylate synthase